MNKVKQKDAMILYTTEGECLEKAFFITHLILMFTMQKYICNIFGLLYIIFVINFVKN